MKKALILIIVFSLLLSFTSCGNAAASTDGRLSVVCTVFPEYDWARQIIGGHESEVSLKMLLDNGIDLHSYQPNADDIIAVSTCDIFIYVGGESDAWVKDALKEAVNRDMIVINLMDVLGSAVKEEEVVEGMEAEEEEGEEVEYDEHVWLSLKNAALFCQSISDALSKADPDNSADYTANAEGYIAQLNSLDGEYQTVVDGAARKTVLFGDRFPFRYLADDYGLTYYAAFVGCSAETEASFETIAFLAGKLDELKLPCVLTLEDSSESIAKTIIQNTADKNQSILTMDSMQSVTDDEVAGGASYLSIMRQNLEALKTALN